MGKFTPERVAVGVVLPGANSLTVVPAWPWLSISLVTKRLPWLSNARAVGNDSPVRKRTPNSA
jgi:hypothetical protein